MKNKTLIAITAISAAILSAAVTSFFLIDKQADVFISKIPDIIGIKTTEGGKENKAVSCVRGDSTQTEFGELSLKHTGENLLGAGREKFYLNGMPLPNSISSADFDEYLNFKGGTAILLDWGNGGDCIGCNGTIPAVLTKYGLSIYNGRNFIFGFNKIIALKNNSEVAFVYAYNNGRKYRLLYKNNKFTLQELPKVYNRTKMDKDCKSAYNIYKGCSNGLPNVGLSFIDQYHAEYNWNNSFFFKNCSTSDYLKLSYSKFSKFYCTYDKNNRNQLETSSQAKAENEAVLKATKAAEAAAARQAAAERAAKLKKQLAEQAAKAAQEARAKALEEQLEAQAKAQAEANLAAAQKREHAASTNSSDQLIISYHGRTFIGKNIAGFGIYVISAENKNGFVTARVCYQNLSRTPHSVGYNNFALLSNIKDLYYPENPYSNNPYPGFVSLGVPKELNPLLTKCGSLYFSVPDNYSVNNFKLLFGRNGSQGSVSLIPKSYLTAQQKQQAAAEAKANSVNNQRLAGLFIQKIQRRVFQAWDTTFANSLRCEVAITLSPTGDIIGQPRIVSRSGNPAFDRAVIQAVESAAPFVPPVGLSYNVFKHVVIKFDAKDLNHA